MWRYREVRAWVRFHWWYVRMRLRVWACVKVDHLRWRLWIITVGRDEANARRVRRVMDKLTPQEREEVLRALTSAD